MAKTSVPIRFNDLDRMQLQLLFEERTLQGFERQLLRYCRWLLKMSPPDREKHYRSVSRMAHAARTYDGGGGIPGEVDCECPMCVEWYPHALRKIEKNAEEAKARRLRERMTPKRPNPSFIYLVLDERTGCIKIGRSKTPNARERTLQSENPTHRMLFAHPADADFERELHQEFAERRVRGEWFRLSEEDIESIKRRVGNQK
ncbi:MAG: GIY-YIG nuclease family protein [Terracidiphilus sp.]